MSWMHDNVWVFFIPLMIIMKIEYTIPGKTRLLEFALFIKFIISHKRRQIEHIFIRLFSIIFRRTLSSRSGSHKLRNTLYNWNIARCLANYLIFPFRVRLLILLTDSFCSYRLIKFIYSLSFNAFYCHCSLLFEDILLNKEHLQNLWIIFDFWEHRHNIYIYIYIYI